jgi:cell division protein FtsI (penicillin-binding protein 3)
MQTPSRSESVWRVRAVAIGMALLWGALVVRLIDLQVFRNDEMAARAERIPSWSETVPARPGDILDRSGRVLATTTTVSSLYVDPYFVNDASDLAAQLASSLNLDAVELTNRLRRAEDKRFVWIKRRLSEDELAAVRELDLPREVVGFRDEYRRHYPQGPLAAHVLGLRGVDNTGRDGLEEGWDAALRGTDGRRTLRRDARGFVIDVIAEESTPPRHGTPVICTIDAALQRQVEKRLDDLAREWRPKSAAAIVIEPASGEVLAMASFPAFDPNHPEEVAPDAWRNQAIASVFEPGSTFKPFLVAWGLERGVLARDELLDCEWGAYRMGRRVLHDHHSYGELSVTDVLVKSSNIGMAKIGERLTNVGLHEACTAFGFGRQTGIGLPGELSGLMSPFDQWNSYSTGSIPMGQEIATTPLQLLVAHAALANGGTRVAPRIVREAPMGVDHPGATPQVVAPIVSPDTARWLVTGPMTEVVTRGTGQQAALPGYTVFGKTGTSQVVDPATGSYSHTRHICSFVCGAPAATPRAVVLVMVEEPSGAGVQYGGVVAAPAARDILDRALRYLGVPPETVGPKPAVAERNAPNVPDVTVRPSGVQ